MKQQFLVRAKAMSGLPELFRCQQVTQLLCEMLAVGVRAEAEIFQTVYGDPGGRQYWGAHLSEPIGAYSLAHMLSVHVAGGAEQLEMARIAIMRAFRDAAAAREHWFVGDTSLAVEDGQTNFAELNKLKVHPRAAVEWLLSKPKREHLVPESLRKFLQPGGEDKGHDGQARAPAPQSVSGRAGAKTRGISEAINELWPNGIPKGLSAKERDNAIVKWLGDKRYSTPANPARAIQRALKARRSS